MLGRIGPLARTFDFVADAAPGVKEILAVGKLCHEVRERHYDLVVVDAEATGHIVAQVGAPKVIRDLVKVGLVREQTDWMLALLQDPAITGVVDRHHARGDAGHRDHRLVAPAASRDRGRTVGAGGQPGAARRCSTAARRAVVDRLDDASACSSTPAGRGVTAVVEAARITEARRRIGAGHLERLQRECPDLPMLIVPELFTRATGRRVGRARRRRARRRTRHEGRSADAPHARGAAPGDLGALLAAKEMVLVCGSGGVGKTTMAAALAVHAATEIGGRVLVLTVDPARRLADALGVGALGNEATPGARLARSPPPASSRAASCGRRCSTPRPGGTS